GHKRTHLGGQGGLEALVHRQGVVTEGPRGGQDGRATRLGDPVGGTLVQPGALLQDQLGVDAGRDLDACVAVPGGQRIGPGLHGVRPAAGRARGDRGAPAVGARGEFPHRRPRASAALRATQDHVRRDGVVSLPEDGGRHLERLTGHRLGRPAPVLDHGAHVEDGDSAESGGRPR
ncbi:hypothetical protein ADK64_26950, partial [Streptomyces sp. MMG1121]